MTRLFAMIVAFVLMLSTNAMAHSRITVLTSDLEPKAKKEMLMAHLKSTVQSLKPGEQGAFINGSKAALICIISVPEGRQYSSDKAKLAVNGPCIRKLMEFADAPQSGLGVHALDWPAVFRFVGDNFGGGKFKIMVVDSSPIYDSPREPNFSMGAAHIPSDGHITASRATSPYSVQGQEEAFAGLSVHWSTQGPDWSINNKHETVVRRFIAAAIGERGGVLATFEPDRALVLANAEAGAKAPVTDYTLSGERKMELIAIPRIIGHYRPLFERNVTAETLPTGTSPIGEQVWVGIRWDCKRCDIDLYGKIDEGAQPIYYARTQTPEGQFYKDFTSGGDMMNGQEVIQFNGPVDFAKLRLAVNFYSGRSNKPITIRLRIATGRRVSEKTIILPAGSGNHSAGRDAVMSHGQTHAGWTLIDLQDRR